jgi:hypothetical protein
VRSSLSFCEEAVLTFSDEEKGKETDRKAFKDASPALLARAD